MREKGKRETHIQDKETEKDREREGEERVREREKDKEMERETFFHCTITGLAAAHTFLMAEISGHACVLSGHLRETHQT